MFFFNFILERLNSVVVDSFNEIFNEYRSAIETFITKPTIYSESNISFITEKSTRDKIYESYKLLSSKKAQSLFKGKLPQRFSYVQKKFIVENISIIRESYRLFGEERVLADNVALLKLSYPHAFKKYCKEKRINPDRLSKADKTNILANKSTLAQEEATIQAQIRHDKLVSDFKKNILDKYPRQYYYKKFHNDFSSDEGMEYFMKHLVELDAFCKYMVDVAPYKALAHYADDFLQSENKANDDYVYLMSSSTILKFHRFAKKKIEDEYKLIESSYPIGTKYYIESINSRCLWPFPKPLSSIFVSSIFSSTPRKSRWEIEQEQKKQDEILRKSAIKLTTQYLCINNITEVKKYQDLYSKVEEIKTLYPLGSKLILDSNPVKADSHPTISPTLSSGEPAPLKGKSFVKYYTDFIQAKNLIRRLQALSGWQKKQLDFCKFVRNLRDELKLSWGCYTYEFPFEGEICDEASNFKTPDVNFKIWQFFIGSFCSADLDYTLCPRYSLENADNESLESGRTTFRSTVYDKIKDFICSLNFEDYSPVVVFADTDDRWEIYHKSSHFLYLRSILQDDAIPEFERLGYILSHDTSKKIIVVVDLITTNNQLKSFASDIIGNIDSANLIVYVSLRKEYSKEEMQSIIDAEQKKIDDKKAAEEAEKRRIQEERERQAREAQQKRLQEERKKQEIRDLKSCVSSWPQPRRSSIEYFSLYNYYPTTCDWDASESEWNIRNLIWDFKAKPHNYQSTEEIIRRHRNSVDIVLPELCKVLRHFFGNKVPKLTLVPVLASTRIVSDRRYADILERICNEMDMYNGYLHVKITKEGISKNDPTNNTGHSIPPEVEYEQNFFKDKYVILFDDVITSGASMERCKCLLEASGATVIGGLSIGKTKHERLQSNPIDTITLDSPF